MKIDRKTGRGQKTSVATLALAVAGLGLPGTAHAATLVLTNASIHTVDPNAPRAEAIAIDDAGMILAVGSEAVVLAAAGDAADVIDMDGMMILPGFQDAHMHLIEAGVNQALCEFEPADKLDNTLAAVADCASRTEEGWIVGSGVSMTNLLEQSDNPIELLDKISTDRPILILDDIGHGAWANSAAMQAAGYDHLQGDPPGGILLRNPENGKPNGVLLENAQQKLRNLAFPDTPERVDFAYRAMLETLATMAENGITSVSDAGGFWPQGHVKVWERALAEDTLTVRASNALYVYPDLPFEQQLADLTALYTNDPDSLLRFNQAKIYVDGILEQRTGAVLEPYKEASGIDHGYDSGFLYFDVDTLDRYAQALSETGFQLHFHVTGDRGARLALDAIARSDAAPGPHRLTHLYLVGKDDIPRFAELGAVADLQLAPSSLDPAYKDFIRELIGDRADFMMPAASLEAAGALVTLSSDFDADELSPLVKIQAAVERGEEGAPNVETAIEWMTINPATLMHQGDTTGSLAPGKFADLVILDRDITDIPVAQIGSANVVATLLQGEPVFDAKGLFAE